MNTKNYIKLKDKILEPRERHSMIYVPNGYIFFIGGYSNQDSGKAKKVFYFSINENSFNYWGELNNGRVEPALYLINNKYLYVLSNEKSNEENNNNLSFERTDLRGQKKWELIFPKIPNESRISNHSLYQNSFNLSLFSCFQKENSLILLGGISLAKNKKIYKYDLKENVIEEISNFNDGGFTNKTVIEKSFIQMKNNNFYQIPKEDSKESLKIYFYDFLNYPNEIICYYIPPNSVLKKREKVDNIIPIPRKELNCNSFKRLKEGLMPIKENSNGEAKNPEINNENNPKIENPAKIKNSLKVENNSKIILEKNPSKIELKIDVRNAFKTSSSASNVIPTNENVLSDEDKVIPTNENIISNESTMKKLNNDSAVIANSETNKNQPSNQSTIIKKLQSDSGIFGPNPAYNPSMYLDSQISQKSASSKQLTFKNKLGEPKPLNGSKVNNHDFIGKGEKDSEEEPVAIQTDY